MFAKIPKEVWISLGCIALTVLFDFVTLNYVDHEKFETLRTDPSKVWEFFAVPFDLWTIALSLTVGGWMAAKREDQGLLVPSAIALVASILLILASLQISALVSPITATTTSPAVVQPISLPVIIWRILLPDIFGVAAVAFSAHAIIRPS